MKKKNWISIAFLCIVSLGYAQTAEKKWGLGFHGGTYRYRGDLGSNFYNLDKLHLTGGLSLSRYLTPSFDFSVIGTAGVLDYANKNLAFQGRLIDFDFLFKYKFNNGKLLAEQSFIAPFIQFGIGDAVYINKTLYPRQTHTDFNFPLGAGLRFNLCKNIALTFQSTYHFSLTDGYDGASAPRHNSMDEFLFHSISLNFSFDKKDDDKDGVCNKKDKCKDTPANVKVDAAGCPLDKDKDGIADYLDKCPAVAGVASGNGCPDKDGDGIVDEQDACADIAGLANLNGCPDSDNDGIIDAKDNCPTVAGKSNLNGCPDQDDDGIIDPEDKCPMQKGTLANKGCPDMDNDGLTDSEDKCPSIAGSIANNGCPEISEETKKVFAQALTGIQFESGKDIIIKTSFPILNNVVEVMKNNPSYMLVINGHTDNQGDNNKNLLLSQKRADAVKKYLSTHGIGEARMTANGYGATQPIEDNKTPKGRAKNRRVEFKVEF